MLIGADGLWSRIREQVVGDGAPRVTGHTTYRSVIPTERVPGAASVYWCVINGRSFVRWVLPYDEDTATLALARLHAADADRLTPDARLLGAFRSCGLLIPVWGVPSEASASDFAGAVGPLQTALDAAAGRTEPLTPDERRARAGLVNRQVTLR